MVQDTGYGTELYRSIGAKDQLLMYGLEETADDSDNSVSTALWCRSVALCSRLTSNHNRLRTKITRS